MFRNHLISGERRARLRERAARGLFGQAKDLDRRARFGCRRKRRTYQKCLCRSEIRKQRGVLLGDGRRDQRAVVALFQACAQIVFALVVGGDVAAEQGGLPDVVDASCGRTKRESTAPRTAWCRHRTRRDCRARRPRAWRPSRPCIIGLPGRIAIFQNAILTPSASSEVLTRSWSPTEAPPVVTRMSAPSSRARRMPAVVASTVSAATPRSTVSAPSARASARKRIAVGIDDLAGAGRLAGHDQLVAGGEQRELRPPPHRQLRIVHAGGEREVAIAEAGAGRQQHVAFAEIDAGRADIAPGRLLLP